MMKISYDMANMAAKHKNDTISLALSRTAEKISGLGNPFTPKLDKTDNMVIKFYLANRDKVNAQ